MYQLTSSELYIKKIENLTRSIKLGNKKPSDVASEINGYFTKLKPLNDGMAFDLMETYSKVVKDYNDKNEKN